MNTLLNNSQNPHLTSCRFQPSLDGRVNLSLSFTPVSIFRSQCHQVSCTLLFFFFFGATKLIFFPTKKIVYWEKLV